MQQLEQQQFRCTRLDIALDDYKRRVDFKTVKEVGDAGYYRLVKFYKAIESSILPGADPVGTVYYGNSDKILRFYNAEAVHGIEADRWELQTRADVAQSAFNVYLNEPECLPTLVVGAVDFGVKGKHYYEFDRFHWWQSLIDDAGFARSIPRIPYEPDLSNTIDWLDTAVAPTLALLREGLGSRFDPLMIELCKGGYRRLKPYQHEWIQTIKKSEIDVFTILAEVQQ